MGCDTCILSMRTANYELVDSTANLEHIKGVVHKRWGTQYTLVTSDGIELEDSPATQGTFLLCKLHVYT